MSTRPRYGRDGMVRLPEDLRFVTILEPCLVGSVGKRSIDPFERTVGDDVLLAESFARLDTTPGRALERWFARHGIVNTRMYADPELFPPRMWSAVDVDPHIPDLDRFIDPLRLVEAERRTVAWHLESIARLSGHLIGGRAARGPWDPAWVRPVVDAASRHVTIAGEAGPVEPLWWAADDPATRDRRARQVRSITDDLFGELGEGPDDLMELQRRLMNDYVWGVAERRVRIRWDGGEVIDRRPKGAALVLREWYDWGSLLVPVYLQLFEGLRRVTEGHRGGAFCRECGRPFLVLDARRTDFCNDRERFRHAKRAGRARAKRPGIHRAGMSRRGPHEGSIHQRKDGRWAGSLNIGWIDGKRVRKHVLAHTRAEAAAKLDELRRLHGQGLPDSDQRLKVGPYLERWLTDVAKPRVRPSTFESYSDIVRLHLVPGLGRIALAKLSPADVQAFLNRKLTGGLSPRRVQYIHAVLRRALVTAERWSMVSRNVAKLVDPPRVPRHEIAPLTPDQAKVLIETSADDRHRALWVTALATGLRQGELLALRWEDVDLEEGRLRVRHSLANVGGTLVLQEPKTDRSRRSIALPEVVVAALRGHRTRQRMDRLVAGPRWVDSGHVFATMRGRPHHAATITRAFQQALDRAGLPDVRFHDLRHSAATFLLAQGMTLEDVKNQLGHSTIVLTSNTYGHVLEQRQREVAAAMDAVLGG